MPGKLITELPEQADALETDELEIQTTAGSTNKITKANLLKTVTDSIAAHLADYNPHAGVKWKGQWQAIQYRENDMALEGDYLGVANKDTLDRLAPQNVGAAVEFVDKTIVATEAEYVGAIKVEHDFTITSEGFIKELWLHTPYFDIDSVVRLTIRNITQGTAQVASGIILKSTEWTLIKASNVFFSPGDLGNISLEQYNASAANSIKGGWQSAGATGTGEPSAQLFNFDNLANPTTMGLSRTDLDGTARAGELDGATVDSRIYVSETGDTTRNIELVVTAVDTAPTASTRCTVDVVTNGPKDIRNDKVCSISIDVPINQPTRCSIFTGEAATPPSFASVITSVFYDNVKQPDTTDAYGISITFQPAISSPDWDIAAVTGASGVNSGFIEHDLAAHTDVSTVSPNEGQLIKFQGGLWTPTPASPTGYKNVLINGRLGVDTASNVYPWIINQREFDGNWSTATASHPGFDRWYKYDNTRIQQKIDVVNMINGATYTLSWEGGGEYGAIDDANNDTLIVGPSPLTVPIDSDGLLDGVRVRVPLAAYNIQLELGSVPTSFEVRPIGLELALCQRYFQTFYIRSFSGAILRAGGGNVAHGEKWTLPVPMRRVPDITVESGVLDASIRRLDGSTSEQTNNLVPGFYSFDGTFLQYEIASFPVVNGDFSCWLTASRTLFLNSEIT